jgi:tRNA pseudouridine38-40 synthase
VSPPGEPVRRIRLELAYDGTEFAGWQRQPGRRTVQGVLERTLARLQGGRATSVRGAGRTDAGVHARRQVADCEVALPLDDGRLAHALRGMLPADLRPLDVRTVDAAFNSRRDALEKTYRYRLDRTLHGDPFLARWALHHPRGLDAALVEAALARLPGRRDWSGFTAASCEIGNRVRTLTRAEWHEAPRGSRGEAWFVFAADGFLTYMARNLVGTLLEVGRGRLRPEVVDEILERGERACAGPTAPPHGLTLWDVRYEAATSRP